MKQTLITAIATLAASATSSFILSWVCKRLGFSAWAALGVLLPCSTLAALIVLRRMRR